MKIANWRAKEVFNEISTQAFKNAETVMDQVAAAAKIKAPVGTITRTATGSSKVWTERIPGSLRKSIRRVSRTDKNNVRVYAGNFQVYYARFVEMGTVKMRKRPYLRPAFQEIKARILNTIRNGR